MPFVNKLKRPWRLSGLGVGISKGPGTCTVYTWAQSRSYLGTLGPKCVLYMYMDPVGVEPRGTDSLVHVGECISSVL